MNWEYGRSSRLNRDSCDPRLIHVMNKGLVRSPVDITIVWGWRDESTQKSMVEMKASKTLWPDSKHNHMLAGNPYSHAFDFAPWVNGSIPWKDTHTFALVAGCFFSAAQELGIRIRWGGDWNMNGTTIDQSFMDYGHIELYTN